MFSRENKNTPRKGIVRTFFPKVEDLQQQAQDLRHRANLIESEIKTRRDLKEKNRFRFGVVIALLGCITCILAGFQIRNLVVWVSSKINPESAKASVVIPQASPTPQIKLETPQEEPVTLETLKPEIKETFPHLGVEGEYETLSLEDGSEILKVCLYNFIKMYQVQTIKTKWKFTPVTIRKRQVYVNLVEYTFYKKEIAKEDNQNLTLALIDELGTLVVFNYPNETMPKTGVLELKIYNDYGKTYPYAFK